MEFLPKDFETNHLGGLAGIKDLEPILTLDLRRQLLKQKLEGTDTLGAIMRLTNPPFAPAANHERPETPSAKRTQSEPTEPTPIARSQPCPCGSGAKYKRCCGRNAPGLLQSELRQAA